MNMINTTTMKTIAMRALFLLAVLWLAVAPPVPSFAAGPDLYMTMGPPIQTSFGDTWTWTVDVTIGNIGRMPPPVEAKAIFQVTRPTGQLVCSAGIPDIPPQDIGPGFSVKAFRFQFSAAPPRPRKGPRPP